MAKRYIINAFFFLCMIAPVKAQTKYTQYVVYPDSKVSEVLNKYIDAAGGKYLKEVETIKRKGTLTRGSLGKVPLEMVSKTGDKWYYKQIFAYGDVVCYGSDGNNFWVQDTREVIQMPEDERIDLQLILDIQTPLKLMNMFHEIVPADVRKTDQENSVTLKATTSKGRTIDLTFDTQTGLLLTAGDICFEDYRQVENIKMPFKIYIGDYSGGEIFRLRMEFDEILLNMEVSDAAFTQPGCFLQPEKSQLYTLRKEVIISEEAMNACVGVYRDLADSTTKYYVSKQKTHLMIAGAGLSKTEIKPTSELDFFVRFRNLEFHFIKDSSGKVVQLELGPGRRIKAGKIG